MKRLISEGPISKQYWEEDSEGNITLHTQSDYTAIIEANKRESNVVDERANWRGDMHRVARIPMDILLDLQRKGITKDRAAFKKWLNDPENRFFRTRPGKI